MKSSNAFLVSGAVILAFVVSCRAVDDPLIRRAMEPPTQPRLTAGPPPPLGYTVSTAGGSRTELNLSNYPYDTWIEIIPDGTTFHLQAYGTAKPITGEVGVGGASGGRNGCDFNTSVSFGQSVSSFGDCGSVVGHYDTTLARGQGFINRGSFPLDYQTVDLSDCDLSLPACHVQEVKNMNFTVRPIPVVMKQVKANPHVVNFSAVQYQQVTFTTGPDPETYLIGGVVRTMPLTTTSWVYTAGDGTLDGNMCNGGFPVLYCMPYLHKSGRMVVKAFVGGWEQTSTITVQCLVTPADPRLNDTTADFKIRESILDMLERANADSSPTAGFDVNHPGWAGGWIHETGFLVWLKANGAVQTDTVAPTYSDACNINFQQPSPPAPGDSLIANGHSHVTNPGDPMYCRTTKRVKGVDVPAAKFPGDPNGPVVFAPPDSIPADDADRSAANQLHSPNYVITNSGLLMRIDNVANDSLPNPQTWYRVFGGTASQRKCSWPRKYKYH